MLDESLNEEVRLFVLGLSPSNARLSVRCWFVDSFGDFIQHNAKFFRDIKIIGADRMTVAEDRKRDRAEYRRESEALTIVTRTDADIVLNDRPLPCELFYALVNRIRADGKVNGVRAGAIKGHLVRVNSKYGGLTVGLDTENNEPAYVLGRLFAALEKAQKDSADGRLESTIKDRYFSSAAATPAVIFPVLLKLSRSHIAKLGPGQNIYYESTIADLLSRIAVFPTHQGLEEQGLFMIGYYHQEKWFYTKREVQ